MGSQRLSAKTMRRIERHTGLPVVRAWAHGGYVYDFVTPDHRHMLVHSKTWEVEEDTQTSPHYNTCTELFPDFDPWAEWEKRYGKSRPVA